MKKKSYTAPQSEVIAIDTIMPIAASGAVNDSEGNGKVEIILPDGGNTGSPDKLGGLCI